MARGYSGRRKKKYKTFPLYAINNLSSKRVSGKAAKLIQDLCTEMCDRIASQASDMMQNTMYKTLNAFDLDSAMTLIVPEGLAQRMQRAGIEAINNV